MTTLQNTVENDAELARLKSVVEHILAESKTQGASSAEAAVSIEKGLSVTARMSDVETIEHHRDQGLGVTVYLGQKKGSASTTDLGSEAIQETVAAACRIACYATEDAYGGLPDEALLAREIPDLDLFHGWEISADQAVGLTVKCEDTARNYDREITNSEGASLNTHETVRMLGNSLGFMNGYRSSRHSLSCSVLGQRGESMQRDYWFSIARDRHELESPESVGEQAAQRTLRRLQAKTLSTRQCPIIFTAEVASGLLGHFIGAISGGSLYRKSSFLLDCLGEKIFPAFVHIHEQPHLSRALGSAPYDGEGVATKARDIVTDGILQGYVLGSYSARKLGMQTTGNSGGVHNLVLDSGELDHKGLLESMGKGLLVTEVMGQGVNIVNGDYSRGAAGFWVENGEIRFPVEEITIAGNLRDMFNNIVAVGNDIDIRGNIRTGSILIKEMTVAGN